MNTQLSIHETHAAPWLPAYRGLEAGARSPSPRVSYDRFAPSYRGAWAGQAPAAASTSVANPWPTYLNYALIGGGAFLAWKGRRAMKLAGIGLAAFGVYRIANP
jgi:hypothetical protein